MKNEETGIEKIQYKFRPDMTGAWQRAGSVPARLFQRSLTGGVMTRRYTVLNNPASYAELHTRLGAKAAPDDDGGDRETDQLVAPGDGNQLPARKGKPT